MNDSVYKIHYLKNNETKSIYVFYGRKTDKSESESELYQQCFSEKEIEQIQQNSIPVLFLNSQIHKDDTILTIKTKILNECGKDLSCSLPEIYLFCQKKEKFTTAEIYESLTRNKKIELTKNRLETFLLNINNPDFYKLEDKSIYSYDDLLQLKLDQKYLEVDKILGQKYFLINGEYPFVHNPYQIKENYDYLYEKTTRHSILGLNQYLLFNTGLEIINNTIYLCLAKDVLKTTEEKGFSPDITTKIYFPVLYSKNIRNSDTLTEKSQELIEENKQVLTRSNLQGFKVVDMFYNVYKERKSELPYLSRGIRSIKAIIHPEFSVKMPLDVLFKLIHATEKNPLIKYNPALRQENIYRLYTDKISNDGQKIPFLNKAIIFKLMKNIGKTKSVAVYLEPQTFQENNQQTKSKENVSYSFICEFMENGDITIISEFEKAIPEDSINEMLKLSINPLLDDIRDFLQQNGYQIPPFISLYEENVEIKYLNYELQIEIYNEMKLDKLNCLSSLFIQEITEGQGKKKKSVGSKKENEKITQMRFKRVSNFNKTTSQEAFIIEKINAGLNKEQVVLGLLENYSGDLNENEAKDLLARIVGQLQVEKGKKKTDIKIKNNPGFKTIFSVNTNTAILTITIENINDIDYLKTVPIFLDSIIRITQDKSSTQYSSETIDRLCTSRILKIKETVVKEKDIHIPNLVIKDSEQPLSNEEPIHIKNLQIFDEPEDSKVAEKKNRKEVQAEAEAEAEGLDEDKIQNAMDLFFGNDDEEEESVSNAVEEYDANTVDGGGLEDETYNGVDVPSELELDDDSEMSSTKDLENITIRETNQSYQNTMKNIDGMSLNNPYFFQERISERDPVLILNKDTGKYNSYSRVCPSSAKRQPVILSDEELKRIEKENPGFLRKEDVISYGSNPNKKFNYICPRFWCLKTNTVLDPKDFIKTMENGKEVLVHPTCGKVLPPKAKKVIPGHYVYEFYDSKDKRYPGLQIDKHPDGYCLPCCFNNWKTSQRLKAVAKCEGKEDEMPEEKEDEYIKGMEKFPLSSGRWGYLSIPLQQFLNISGQTCKSNSGIPCFLRHGVETSIKQSFLACIADAYYYATSTKIPSIRDFKKMMVENLSIDHFINYQNGNLVNDFYNSNMDVEKVNDFIKSERSITSKLYSLVYSPSYSSNSDAIFYYQKVANSFLNFADFLKDDKIVIDHTYLWDMVTQPKTFIKDRNIPSREVYHFGFNLVILEIPDNDITQNIEIICPTNHYTSESFNPKLGTLILMKKDEFYEPIYSYLDMNQNISINRFFYADTKYDNIRHVLAEILYPLMNTICKPLPSIPNRYSFQEAIPLANLKKLLKDFEYTIVKYVFNFNNKIIGVIVSGDEIEETFVPCYPSAFDKSKTIEKEKTVFMTDPTLWKSYEETVTSLSLLKAKSNEQIPCKPMINVVEDELIVGILTETNQFIQINPPIQKIDIPKDIRLKTSIQGNNSILADVKTVGSKGEEDVDVERVEMIKKIRMESNFYNVFRNTIRILLNDYENVKNREELESVLKNESLLYLSKLEKVKNLLMDLVGVNALFIGDEKYYQLISEVSTCIVKDSNKCSGSNVCAVVEKEGKSVCQLILPKNNLVSGKENEPIYYGRMADELMRYTRIQNFMFQPQTYLSFGNNQVKYNLRENEMILIQSMITQEYFNHLIPMSTNPFIKNNSYDIVEPVIHPLYENDVNLKTIKTMIPKKITQKKIILEEDKEITPSLIKKLKPSTIEIKEPINIDNSVQFQEEIIKEEKSAQVINNIMNLKNVCKDEVEKPIFDKKRNQLFPENYKEFKYKNNNVECTFDCIIVLLNVFNHVKTIYQIREDLLESYQPYLLQFQTKILDILKIEKKEALCNQVLQGTLTFENMIMNDAYFLSLFDLWILVQKYQLPTVFMSTYKLLETNSISKIMVGFQNNEKDNTNQYFFIVIPPITKKTPDNKPPINRLILSDENQLLINIDQLNQENEIYKDLVKSMENPKTIKDFLIQFHR